MLRVLSRALTEGRRAAGPLASRAAEPLRTTDAAVACSGGVRAFAAVPEPVASEPIANEPTDGEWQLVCHQVRLQFVLLQPSCCDRDARYALLTQV